MLWKSIFRTIRGSLGRYLAILFIIALGVGFFSGLRVTEASMLETGNGYLDELNLYDFRLVSTLGLTDDDVAAFQKMDGIESAVGSVSGDLIFYAQDGSDAVFHAHSLLDGVNGLDLVDGRMPESKAECVLDARYLGEDVIGKQIILSKNNSQDTFNTFACDAYTVVGTVNSAEYINFQRGSTALAGGSVAGYIYLLPEGFTTDYYTEIYLTISAKADIYSDAYDHAIETLSGPVETLLNERGGIRYQHIYNDAKAEIDDAQAKLDEKVAALDEAKQEVENGWSDYRAECAKAKNALAQTKAQLDAARAELDHQRTMLEEAKSGPAAAVPEIQAQLSAQEAVLNQQEKLYTANLAAYTKAYRDAYAGFAQAEQRLTDAQAEIDKAAPEIADAQAEINDARQKLSEIKPATVYALDRDSNFGYVSFQNDTAIVSGVAKIFPLFFFLVAALICITTMTRMVDEQRTHNGVLKALGYGNGAVASQYLIYAGSASVVGCVVGFLLGSRFMPVALWQVYRIMYSIDRPIAFVLDWALFAFCSLLYLGCALGATWFVCYRDLRESAAQLIRAKAPEAGKRVLLERVGFIWKRLNFLHKVSVRNIFRYKKRMVMMIIGIGGCTALLLAGFGIRDTIQPVVSYQYEEISLYDAAVSFMREPTEQQAAEFIETGKRFATDQVLLHTGNVDIRSDGDTAASGLVVYRTELSAFVNLHDGKKAIAWPRLGEAVINYRFAQEHNIQVGDMVQVSDSDYQSMNVKISGIYDNYIGDYIYISEETCAQQWGYTPKINTAYLNLAENQDGHKASAELLSMDNVASVSLNSDLKETVEGMLNSLNYIVLIVLICAGALAFIVLYNLTNITITERVREIATLKVLGFYTAEQNSYVFRENIMLTAISSLVGIPFGILLLRYVMSYIQISPFYFGCRLAPISYLWAILLTLAFTIIVDLAMTSKTKRINMAEALKAIE